MPFFDLTLIDPAIFGELSGVNPNSVKFSSLGNVLPDGTVRVAGEIQAPDLQGVLKQTGVLVGMFEDGVAFDDFGQVQIYDLNHFNLASPPLIESEALGTNDLNPNDVVGWSTDSTGKRSPTLWTKTQTIRLPTLGGAEGEAWDVNNKRQVVGWSHDVAGNKRATTWNLPAGFQPADLGVLGTLSGDALATAINEAGQIVGSCDIDPGQFPFLRRASAFIFTPGGTDGVPGNPQMRAVPQGPQDTSQAWDINDSGQVVGQTKNVLALGGGTLPFFWSQVAGLHILPTFANEGAALGINATGQIVGTALSAMASAANGARVAAFWPQLPLGAPVLDLNADIPARADLRLVRANSINDKFQIVGSAASLVVGGFPDTAGFLLYPSHHPNQRKRIHTWIDELFQAGIGPAMHRGSSAPQLQSGDAIHLLFLAEAAGTLRNYGVRTQVTAHLLQLAADEIRKRLPKERVQLQLNNSQDVTSDPDRNRPPKAV